MLKAVWGMKRETFAMVAKAHVKNVIVVGPMEALEVRNDVDEVRGVMADGVHLDEKALDVLVDYVLKKAEEHFVSKKRGPTERSGRDGKRPRIASKRREDRRRQPRRQGWAWWWRLAQPLLLSVLRVEWNGRLTVEILNNNKIKICDVYANFRLCSARDWERSGLLEEIPRVVVQKSALL
jgi:hypothetical protein